MRQYLSERNLVRAFALACVVTVMSVPRILVGGLSPGLLIPSTLVGMTLVSGAATAWGRRTGMPGLFPPRERMLKGVGIGLILACVLAPVCVVWLDPLFAEAIRQTGNVKLMRLQYPPTRGECLALVLWSAGFELMFFCVASVSFFARLLNRRRLGILLAVALRLCVLSYQIAESHITDAIPLFVIDSALTSTIACALFAYMGLPAAAAFVAALEMRLLLMV